MVIVAVWATVARAGSRGGSVVVMVPTGCESWTRRKVCGTAESNWTEWAARRETNSTSCVMTMPCSGVPDSMMGIAEVVILRNLASDWCISRGRLSKGMAVDRPAASSLAKGSRPTARRARAMRASTSSSSTSPPPARSAFSCCSFGWCC
ncbi:hypothetical protein DFJ73DRAFT_854791 [Zopfochytrium polystomum]|nr:hypothetical protein DFJ73DRAFT_854791 [Zopfochytrium polystomum]